jgi:adenylate kinase family enzyme
LIKQYLNAPKAHFYTKGYAIIGFPSTISQARLFQEALTGYVPEEERLNEEAELLKKKIVEMAAPQTPPPSNFLLTSGIDMVSPNHELR